MAQCCGDTLYDFAWDKLLNAILPRLQNASDRWAVEGFDALSPDRVCALLLRLFSNEERVTHHYDEWRVPKFFSMPFDAALASVETTQQELQRFRRKLVFHELQEVHDELLEALTAAAKSWSDGDSETPFTDEVLNWVVAILFNYRLVRRPPKPHWPRNSILK